MLQAGKLSTDTLPSVVQNSFMSISLTKFRYLRLIVFVAFLAINSINLFHHDLWQDETQLWSIAANAESFSNLVNLSAQEGRTVLWPSLLMVLQVISSDVQSIKLLILVCNCATFYFVLNMRKLSLIVSCCALLTFPFLYGLTVHSRDYSLVLTFLCFYFYLQSRSSSVMGKLLVICLLGSVSGYSALMAGCLLIRELVIEFLRVQKLQVKKKTLPYVFASLFLLFSLVVSTPDNGRISLFSSPIENWVGYLIGFARAIQNGMFFGQTHLSNPEELGMLFRPLFLVFSLLSIAFLLFVLRSLSVPDRICLLLYTGIFCIQSIFVFPGSWWSHSLFYVLALLLLINNPMSHVKKRLDSKRFVTASIIVVGVFTSFFGIGQMFSTDRKFSNSSEAAKIIKSICEQNCSVAIEEDVTGQPISSHLGKPVFYLNRGEYGTFTKWQAISKTNSQEVMRYLIIQTLETKRFDFVVTTKTSLVASEAGSYVLVKALGKRDSVNGENYQLWYRKSDWKI